MDQGGGKAIAAQLWGSSLSLENLYKTGHFCNPIASDGDMGGSDRKISLRSQAF